MLTGDVLDTIASWPAAQQLLANQAIREVEEEVMTVCMPRSVYQNAASCTPYHIFKQATAQLGCSYEATYQVQVFSMHGLCLVSAGMRCVVLHGYCILLSPEQQASAAYSTLLWHVCPCSEFLALEAAFYNKLAERLVLFSGTATHAAHARTNRAL